MLSKLSFRKKKKLRPDPSQPPESVEREEEGPEDTTARAGGEVPAGASSTTAQHVQRSTPPPRPEARMGHYKFDSASTTSSRPKSAPRPERTRTSLTSTTSGQTSSSGDSGAPQKGSQATSLDDPVWKVLPAVFKRYGVEGDWREHVMKITYTNADQRAERFISFSEKPLLIFSKLKEANKNPQFSFMKMSEILSPVELAYRRYEALRAAGHVPAPAPSRPDLDLRIPHPTLSGARKSTNTLSGDTSSLGSTLNVSIKSSARLSGTTVNTFPSRDSWSSKHPSELGSVAPPAVSYAVAVFPWMAEHEDELNAEVGDAFIILSRSSRWWVVQRDENGTGIIEESSQHGWVPSGSLLELNIPISLIISETERRKKQTFPPAPFIPHPFVTSPILPQDIVTSWFPGVALWFFKARGEEEVDVKRDEGFGIYKKYDNWCYIVKENGERGWVPSYIIQFPPMKAPSKDS